jgi:hypothetical protein
VHLEPLFLRRGAQRIGPRALFFGRAEHRADLVAASEERLEHRFTEILLSYDRDSHSSLHGFRRIGRPQVRSNAPT